jgi:hypothetical protein
MSLSVERGDPFGTVGRRDAALPVGKPCDVARRDSRVQGVSLETILLLVVCTLDLVSSAWLFHHGLAREANPLLRGFAEAGVAPFAMAKAASFVPGLFAAEWYRRMRPGFVILMLRTVLVVYLLIYGISVGGQFLR